MARPLRIEYGNYSNGPTIADHAFHEFSSLRLATEHDIASLDCWGDTSVLLDTFRTNIWSRVNASKLSCI
jgi:hypothetical protein